MESGGANWQFRSPSRAVAPSRRGRATAHKRPRVSPRALPDRAADGRLASRRPRCGGCCDGPRSSGLAIVGRLATNRRLAPIPSSARVRLAAPLPVGSAAAHPRCGARGTLAVRVLAGSPGAMAGGRVVGVRDHRRTASVVWRHRPSSYGICGTAACQCAWLDLSVSGPVPEDFRPRRERVRSRGAVGPALALFLAVVAARAGLLFGDHRRRNAPRPPPTTTCRMCGDCASKSRRPSPNG
jgi:hypothetical protein